MLRVTSDPTETQPQDRQAKCSPHPPNRVRRDVPRARDRVGEARLTAPRGAARRRAPASPPNPCFPTSTLITSRHLQPTEAVRGVSCPLLECGLQRPATTKTKLPLSAST